MFAKIKANTWELKDVYQRKGSTVINNDNNSNYVQVGNWVV